MPLPCLYRGHNFVLRGMMTAALRFRNFSALASVFLLLASLSGAAAAQTDPLVLEREGRVISLEPYAANILRVTISTDAAAAKSAPGFGFVASPAFAGWTHERDAQGGDIFRSAKMTMRVSPQTLPEDRQSKPMPLDALNLALRQPYFGGGHSSRSDAMEVTTAAGKQLLRMRSWTMAPETAEVAKQDAGAKGFRVAAVFDSRADEHYYGLGQQQKGWMDLRDHQIRCWHDYDAIGGEDVCVPFLISTNGYGLIWDNPSKTTIDLGFNGQSVWSSEVGNRVSYFVIAGDTTDDLYQAYRLLTGVTHMLPKAAIWIYPKQGDLSNTGADPRRRQGVSCAQASARCGGRRLPEPDPPGRDGPGGEHAGPTRPG